MKNWFLGLSIREQSLVKYGAGTLMFGLLLAFVYLPVTRSLSAKYVRVSNVSLQVSQMKQQLNSAQGLKVSGSVPTDVTFSSWLDSEMVSMNLQNLVTRAEPVDENTMTLWLQNAPFDVVADWLALIENSFGVSAMQVDVVAKDRATGLCDLRMTLVK